MARSKCFFHPRTNPLELNCDRSGRPPKLGDRRCVIGAAREILSHISGTVHIVHGPLGCSLSARRAAGFDIRGEMSNPFSQYSTGLKEKDIIFGGEKRLESAIAEAIEELRPDAVFVYPTCVSSLIGDNVSAVCKRCESRFGIPVVTTDCKGYKIDGVRLAAPSDPLFELMGTKPAPREQKRRINLLGEFGSGEMAECLRRIGIDAATPIPGGATVSDIQTAHTASLNLTQRSRPMAHLARRMQASFGVANEWTSFLGTDDCAQALLQAARHFGDEETIFKAKQLARSEIARVRPRLDDYRKCFEGARAVVNPGGAYKAPALVRFLRSMGIEIDALSLRASQPDEVREIESALGASCRILDDATPREICQAAESARADIVIGDSEDGLACRKQSIPFCLHNGAISPKREGFDGAIRFASDIYSAMMNPAWRLGAAERFGQGSSPP